MVSLTLLAAIGIGGFVAYKVVGAVSPKIQVSMPGIELPDFIRLAGIPDLPSIPTPTAAGLKEALSGFTDPLQKAVNTLTETAAKIPAPTDVTGYVDDKIKELKDYVYAETEEGKQFLIDSRDRVEQIARDAITAVEEVGPKTVAAVLDVIKVPEPPDWAKYLTPVGIVNVVKDLFGL